MFSLLLKKYCCLKIGDINVKISASVNSGYQEHRYFSYFSILFWIFQIHLNEIANNSYERLYRPSNLEIVHLQKWRHHIGVSLLLIWLKNNLLFQWKVFSKLGKEHACFPSCSTRAQMSFSASFIYSPAFFHFMREKNLPVDNLCPTYNSLPAALLGTMFPQK